MGLLRFIFYAVVVWFVWRLLDGWVVRSRHRDADRDRDRYDDRNRGGGGGRGGNGRMREDKLGEYVDYEEVDR